MVARFRANKTSQGSSCSCSQGSKCCCGYSTHATQKPFMEDPSIDACGLRKRLRIQVCKPVCLTVFGLGDERLIIDQLYGHPGCWARKPVMNNGARVYLNTEDCEITMIKPGTYEINMEDYGLFPDEFTFYQNCISLEAAKATAEVGNVVIA